VTLLGLPLFIKPANAGSSVGVHKVTSEEEYVNAVSDAFLYDRKLLVEEAVSGIEVECAILGNENPKASVLGGVKVTQTFYSFENKYISSASTEKSIPLHLPEDLTLKIRQTAIQAYQAIGCEGLSRVDFFLREDGTFFINEINTLPGFTSSSMYPKLWEASGLPYSDLLDQLIDLGWQRHEIVKTLKTTW
jgi:D-alanine-D-alanine ligase